MICYSKSITTLLNCAKIMYRISKSTQPSLSTIVRKGGVLDILSFYGRLKLFFQNFSRLICATNWSLKSMIKVLLNIYSDEILNFDFQFVIIVYSVF